EHLSPRRGSGEFPGELVELIPAHRDPPSLTTQINRRGVVALCGARPCSRVVPRSYGGARLQGAPHSWIIAHLHLPAWTYLLAAADCVRACSPLASARTAGAPVTTSEATFPSASTSTAIGVPVTPKARATVKP